MIFRDLRGVTTDLLDVSIAWSSPKDMKQKRKSKQKQTFAFKNMQAPNA